MEQISVMVSVCEGKGQLREYTLSCDLFHNSEKSLMPSGYYDVLFYDTIMCRNDLNHRDPHDVH